MSTADSELLSKQCDCLVKVIEDMVLEDNQTGELEEDIDLLGGVLILVQGKLKEVSDG